MLIYSLAFALLTTSVRAWELVWSDEFDGDSNVPDVQNWNYDVGGNGWGNNELQFHTDLRSNSFVSGGNLHIVARKEDYGGRGFTSARLRTQYKQKFTYGRFEARIQIPRVQGAWPAFWMLGSDFPQVGWPTCGEIDIMEWVYDMQDSTYAPTQGNVIRGSVHGPGYSGAFSKHGDWNSGLTDGYHVYALEWTPTSIQHFVDGELYSTITPDDASPWVFDENQGTDPNFFIIVNLAIGGWGGQVVDDSLFPLEMLVDYIRVYEDSGSSTGTSAPSPSPDSNSCTVQLDSQIEACQSRPVCRFVSAVFKLFRCMRGN